VIQPISLKITAPADALLHVAVAEANVWMLVVPSVAVAELVAVNGFVVPACDTVSTSDTLPGLRSEVTPSVTVEDSGIVEASARDPNAKRTNAHSGVTFFMENLVRTF
jgi:hypothetical protein